MFRIAPSDINFTILSHFPVPNLKSGSRQNLQNVQTEISGEHCCNVSSPEIAGRERNMKQNQANHSKHFPQIS